MSGRKPSMTIAERADVLFTMTMRNDKLREIKAKEFEIVKLVERAAELRREVVMLRAQRAAVPTLKAMAHERSKSRAAVGRAGRNVRIKNRHPADEVSA